MAIEEPARFRGLLLAGSQANDLPRREQIDQQLWAGYCTESAVFVLEMSGFSRRAHTYRMASPGHCSHATGSGRAHRGSQA